MPLTVPNNAVGVIGDLEGYELLPSEIDFLQQPELSGIILFARNYQDAKQLAKLTDSVLTLRPDLLICADQEGGRVQRFREGFTRLPAMLKLAALYEKNSAEALSLAHELGWLMASEIRACQVHLSFAPVLDIDYGCSSVIGDRAFGHNAATVRALAECFIDGMQEAGMAAVGKHFPGHGAVSADSHLALPIDERSYVEIQQDIQPFKELIQAQKMAGIMPAHVIYTQLDPQHTAGFSALWLQQILRAELGFNGVIFSDDLTMAGAAHLGGYPERALAAVNAGANALLVCNKRDAAQQVIDTVRTLNCPHLDLSHWQGEISPLDLARQEHVRQLLAKLNML